MLNGFANGNMSQNRFMARTRQLSNSFANAIGSSNNYTSKSKAPLGQQFANAIGKTPTLINPVGYTPRRCGSGNTCPTGFCCLTNGTLVATGQTGNWCIKCSELNQKFDGGFDYASGSNGDPILGL